MRRFVSHAALVLALAASAVAIYLWTIPSPWTDMLPDGLLAKLGRVLGVVGTAVGLLGSLSELLLRRRRPAEEGVVERPVWWRSARARAGVACAGFMVLGLTIVAQPVFSESAALVTPQAAGPLMTPPASGAASAPPGPAVTLSPSISPGGQATPRTAGVSTAPPSRPPTAPGTPAKAAGPPPITINVSSAKYIEVDGGQEILVSDRQIAGDNNDVMIETRQITSKGNTELAEATNAWQCGPLSDSQIPLPYPPGRWCGRTGLQHRIFRLEVTEAPGVNMRTITVTYPDPA